MLRLTVMLAGDSRIAPTSRNEGSYREIATGLKALAMTKLEGYGKIKGGSKNSFFVFLDESPENSYIIKKWTIDIFSTLLYSVLSTQR